MSITFKVVSLLFAGSLMVLMESPVTLGMVIMVLNLVAALSLGMLSSSWYAFILFLIYVGAIMVMFVYVCLLSSDSKFSPGFSLVPAPMAVTFFIVWRLNFYPESAGLFVGTDLVDDNFISFFLALVILLFIALLAVVLISNIAPLRSYAKN